MSEPFRVLQVVTHMNRGGLETMLMNYYRKIDRTKLQFDFLTHREYDGDYGSEIYGLGGKIYHLPTLNPFNKTYKSELGRFFEKHKEYQVIHVHQDCMSSVVLKIAKQHGILVRIAHSHCSNQDKNLKYPIKLFFKRFISKYATDLIACGQEAGEWMFEGAPFWILNNAIDAKKYIFNSQKRVEQRKKWDLKDDELVVGHVGRFSPQKNHIYLIRIFYELQKKCSAKLMLVGGGDLKEQIQEKVVELDLQDKVIFTGLRSDVQDLLQAMDVFVFPSNYEGLPVTMIEAQAAGLPCLISDKVPIECKKTALVKQLSLSDSTETWVEEIIKMSAIEHLNMYEVIKKAGFDIEENTRTLQQFYIDKFLKDVKANELKI